MQVVMQAVFHERVIPLAAGTGKVFASNGKGSLFAMVHWALLKIEFCNHRVTAYASSMRLFLLTALTMIAFAGNSVLARLALADGAIDADSYSLLRIGSGVVMLVVLVRWKMGVEASRIAAQSNFISGGALFVYVAAFSYAYLALDAGIGALILFACVQATMIGWGLLKGDRPGALEWTGMVAAFGGFVWLVSPGLSAPPAFASALMAVAGIAWGIYSLRGKSATEPLLATTGNFARALPFVLVLVIFGASETVLTGYGALLAILSGAITSGLGYALWYWCLPQLTAVRAGIVQLTVPAIATLGGVVFLAEPLSWRLILCSALILGGVALAISAKPKSG